MNAHTNAIDIFLIILGLGVLTAKGLAFYFIWKYIIRPIMGLQCRK